MARRFADDKLRMLSSVAVLARNTAWRCGHVERLIVRHLQHSMKTCRVADMMSHFKLKGKERSEFLDSLKRLENRHIIRLVC